MVVEKKQKLWDPEPITKSEDTVLRYAKPVCTTRLTSSKSTTMRAGEGNRDQSVSILESRDRLVSVPSVVTGSDGYGAENEPTQCHAPHSTLPVLSPSKRPSYYTLQVPGTSKRSSQSPENRQVRKLQPTTTEESELSKWEVA
jgi:hypothetical protein